MSGRVIQYNSSISSKAVRKCSRIVVHSSGQRTQCREIASSLESSFWHHKLGTRSRSNFAMRHNYKRVHDRDNLRAQVERTHHMRQACPTGPLGDGVMGRKAWRLSECRRILRSCHSAAYGMPSFGEADDLSLANRLSTTTPPSKFQDFPRSDAKINHVLP